MQTLNHEPPRTPAQLAPENDCDWPQTSGGILRLPANPKAVVLFVTVEGDEHSAPHAQHVAQFLIQQNFAILHAELRSDHDLGGEAINCISNAGTWALRLAAMAQWAAHEPLLRGLKIGCIGFGAGGTAALMLAGAMTSCVDALVIADAQPHLVGERISSIAAPTLLMATATHDLHQRMSEIAFARLHCEKSLEIISSPGTADARTIANRSGRLAANWFTRYVCSSECFREKRMEFHR
jgi:hypothetical protein